MSEITEQVGQMIRNARKAKGLTQKELGLKLGLTEATVNGYEAGRQNLTLETLLKVSVALDMQLEINLK
ncbi:helix-turn-helix domain-containing protein [Arsenicibacter rosenii]|uniref:Transcriptional regulator n=1 Tax=Arsenicibacter rosenii TaxID=1750698 RepID=A0A1S2VMI6_9BACT|nr:helix-turn-helix transcriptional regulator [Arsenicibacter rosenii]OIN59969.1 transcriptional regulator [Arsenicibacter rosenii]